MIRGMDVRLKICGMREHRNIVEVGQRRPDYMGFILYKGSPRYVGEEFVVPDALPRSVRKVGVFVNASTDEMLDQALRHSLTAVQLHGNESPEQCLAIRDKGYQVIKAFPVDNAFDFGVTIAYESCVDFFMFDAKGIYHGGNARPFDWIALRQYNQSVPFFLSGGLSPENVAGIRSLLDMNLHALDVNSGIEDAPGLKSLARLAAFENALEKMNDLSL